jgi:hypothetical protein
MALAKAYGPQSTAGCKELIDQLLAGWREISDFETASMSLEVLKQLFDLREREEIRIYSVNVNSKSYNQAQFANLPF